VSNFLGLATVTAALRLELKHALDEEALAMPGSMVHGATVTAVRPDGPATGLPDHGVNIFLYHVTPNVARRNEDLPSRDTRGNLVQRPRAAVDLHYILTFYGSDGDLEAERLMGVVIRRLHERAILTKPIIESARTDPGSPYLADSNLADDEPLRLTPETLSVEDLSKVWSILLQTAYRPSLTYRASVVLLESDAAPRTTLPVRDYDVEVITLPHLAIARVRAAGQDPALRNEYAGRFDVPMGTTELEIEGVDLLADETDVVIDGDTADPPSPGSTGTSLQVTVSALTPGVHTVQVIRRVAMGKPNAEPHVGFASNTAILVVPPEIDPRSPGYVPDATDPRIELLAPGAEGEATLLLYTAGKNGLSYTLRSRPRGEGDPFVFGAPDLAKETYLMRLQVGGVTSTLEPNGIGPYNGPNVTVT
jgi:hypothetical protein